MDNCHQFTIHDFKGTWTTNEGEKNSVIHKKNKQFQCEIIVLHLRLTRKH